MFLFLFIIPADIAINIPTVLRPESDTIHPMNIPKGFITIHIIKLTCLYKYHNCC